MVPNSRAAWFMVAAAFIAGFVVFGVMYSFGAFFQPMAAEFHADRAQTSAFFSITGMIFYMSGSLAGHLSDRLGPRIVVGTGATVMGASLVLTASIGQLWVGYLTYGVGVGIGAACVLPADARDRWRMVRQASERRSWDRRGWHRVWDAGRSAGGRHADPGPWLEGYLPCLWPRLHCASGHLRADCKTTSGRARPRRSFRGSGRVLVRVHDALRLMALCDDSSARAARLPAGIRARAGHRACGGIDLAVSAWGNGRSGPGWHRRTYQTDRNAPALQVIGFDDGRQLFTLAFVCGLSPAAGVCGVAWVGLWPSHFPDAGCAD